MDTLRQEMPYLHPEKNTIRRQTLPAMLILSGWMALCVAGCGATSPYIAFSSKATNLVSGDTNTTTDIFTADVISGKTSLRIMASDGSQPNGRSGMPSISEDGKVIVFSSEASNLVPGDTNGKEDIFIAETATGRVVKRILGSTGEQPDGPSTYPSISADGNTIAFSSDADNLVPEDTNGNTDTFIADVKKGRVVRRIVRDNGDENICRSNQPSLSGDGNFVAFTSTCLSFLPADIEAENVNQDCIYIADTTTGKAVTRILAFDGSFPNAFPYSPSLNRNGRYVAFSSGASNLVSTAVKNAIFIGDRETGRVISYLNPTIPAIKIDNVEPSISDNGRFVSFTSRVSTDQSVEGYKVLSFIGDRNTNTVTQLKQTNGQYCVSSTRFRSSVISGDGSMCVFSCADYVINGKYNLYIGDASTGEVLRKIVASDGSDGNDDSNEPSF